MNAILQFKISIDIEWFCLMSDDDFSQNVEDLQFQTFVLIEILNFKTALFEICFFLYFLKLSAGRGFET